MQIGSLEQHVNARQVIEQQARLFGFSWELQQAATRAGTRIIIREMLQRGVLVIQGVAAGFEESIVPMHVVTGSIPVMLANNIERVSMLEQAWKKRWPWEVAPPDEVRE